MVWVIMRQRGASSDRRRSSCSSFDKCHLLKDIKTELCGFFLRKCVENMSNSIVITMSTVGLALSGAGTYAGTAMALFGSIGRTRTSKIKDQLPTVSNYQMRDECLKIWFRYIAGLSFILKNHCMLNLIRVTYLYSGNICLVNLAVIQQSLPQVMSLW